MVCILFSFGIFEYALSACRWTHKWWQYITKTLYMCTSFFTLTILTIPQQGHEIRPFQFPAFIIHTSWVVVCVRECA